MTRRGVTVRVPRAARLRIDIDVAVPGRSCRPCSFPSSGARRADPTAHAGVTSRFCFAICVRCSRPPEYPRAFVAPAARPHGARAPRRPARRCRSTPYRRPRPRRDPAGGRGVAHLPVRLRAHRPGCDHLQCPSGEPMKKEIAERLARGEDGETILAAFRTHYGEKVLSSPTLRGFDWLAWVTPVSRRPGGRARRHARHPPLPAVGSRDNAGKFA